MSSNHHSAEQHGEHIDHFISVELQHQAIVGPFQSPPFDPWTRFSLLMTRPKRGSDKRRVIVDLSFPFGEAVNDGINITSIYGCDTTYTLPTVCDLTTLIQQAPNTAWMWKADFSCAYRQLRVDPIDSPLLGFSVGSGIYIDKCPSFGCRSSSASCQRVSAAVVLLMARAGYKVLAFLDDLQAAKILGKRLSSLLKLSSVSHNLSDCNWRLTNASHLPLKCNGWGTIWIPRACPLLYHQKGCPKYWVNVPSGWPKLVRPAP